MDLQTRKIFFVQEFLKLQNEEIISSLENILRKKKTEFYDSSLKPMSIEQLNNSIDQSLDDSINDRMVKASDLKSKTQEWG
jgi:hypothetical protein